MTIERYLPSYGRNRGRALSAYQQWLVDVLLPRLSSPITQDQTQMAARVGDWAKSLVSNAPENGFTQVALEIGFGGGEHLLAQAAHHPETLFIGCEPFINGVAKCLVGIEAQKLTNIRLFTDDARKLMEALPDQCLDSVFILFPDPWPKARHNKRRLVNAKTLSMLARVHKPGGRLLLATDHVDYLVWMLEVLQHSPDYRWTAREKADWQTPPSDWTETKYQRKTSAEGRAPVFLECVRR